MRANIFFVPALKWAAVIFLVSLATPLLRGADQTNSPAAVRVPHEVLAFYYTWYGPSRHWGKVDAARHDIEASRDYPVKGAYDSHDPAIIAWQISAAQKHGITGFIATWWGQGTYEDQAVPLVLETAARKHFKATIYWETAPGKGPEQIDNAVNDLAYMLTRYGTNRTFLKADGKPVIFVYGRVMGQVPFGSWPEIISRARAKAGDFLLIADGYSERNASLFDGVHTYNICGSVKGKTPAELRAGLRRIMAMPCSSRANTAASPASPSSPVTTTQKSASPASRRTAWTGRSIARFGTKPSRPNPIGCSSRRGTSGMKARKSSRAWNTATNTCNSPAITPRVSAVAEIRPSFLGIVSI